MLGFLNEIFIVYFVIGFQTYQICASDLLSDYTLDTMYVFIYEFQSANDIKIKQ